MHDSPSYRPGSTEDFDRLYRDSYQKVLRTLLAMLRDRAAAEDCVQEAFLRAYRAWPRWRPDAPAEAWIHRIAINVATSYRRRHALMFLTDAFRTAAATRGGPRADPSDSGYVLEALRRLPAQQAAALVLRYVHGYSNREISAALRVPESTVASRLAASRTRLRHELGTDRSGIPDAIR